MTTKYTKYRVTSQSSGEDDKLTVFIPWYKLEEYVALYLDNCMTVTIDGGIKEERDDD